MSLPAQENELYFLHTKYKDILATDHDIFIGTNADKLETHINTSAPQVSHQLDTDLTSHHP
jgi:hypothetical protein